LHSALPQAVLLITLYNYGNIQYKRLIVTHSSSKGGLAGIPFTGKGGYGALSHHLVKDGNLLLLFAPHVGISGDGLHLGQYNRAGQAYSTAACGAAVGAFNHCLARKPIPQTANIDTMDFQMDFLISEVSKVSKMIEAKETANEQMAALATEMYTLGKRCIDQIVDVNIRDREGNVETTQIFLLGGIMINMPGPMPDYFQPLLFEKRSATHSTEDLMHVFT
jgi:hypothetical protein